ncbi:unnamed protein product [Ilex paraguariensis]|uniref:Uncharacterized protein n=1 Tax=Ilex paraguariensis TaxID=185542 RepID=A0ABC8TFZ8_9AQUA
MSFVGSHFSPPQEISRSKVEKVETSHTTVVEDLEEEVPIYNEGIESFEDKQDAYGQLHEQLLKQQRRLLVLRGRVNTSEEDRKTLHVNLVKSNAHVCKVKEEKKYFQDKICAENEDEAFYTDARRQSLPESPVKKCAEASRKWRKKTIPLKVGFCGFQESP